MELHFYQEQILKRLCFNEKLRFTDLNIEGLTSKYFNYHLQELVKNGLVERIAKGYELTTFGKEYVAKVDTDNMHEEIMPKVNVGILVERVNNEGKKEYLCSKRLKQPYYGKVGGINGKVRFGEPVEDTARRELIEETGLSGDFHLAKMVRKIAYKYDVKTENISNEVVQDQVTFLFLVTNPTGTFKSEIKEQENFWQTYYQITKRKDIYNTFIKYLDYCIKERMSMDFETITIAEGF